MPGRALKSVPSLDLSTIISTETDTFDPTGNHRRGLPCGHWCEPLHLLDATVRGKPYVGWFDPNDFMRMDQDVREGRRITHYKHRITRHYIHLDDTGQPWGWPPMPPGTTAFVAYGPITTLAALDAVGIWELPWMKDALHAEQRGFRWSDRTKHPVVKAAMKRMTPQQRIQGSSEGLRPPTIPVSVRRRR